MSKAIDAFGETLNGPIKIVIVFIIDIYTDTPDPQSVTHLPVRVPPSISTLVLLRDLQHSLTDGHKFTGIPKDSQAPSQV